MSHPRQNSFGPTQKDIGEALTLSQSTVALALNPKHQHKLPPETVALIQAKAQELGYRPQRMARILRNGRSHTIGAVYRSGVYHAPQERVKFLAQSAIKAGYQLVALDLDWFGTDQRAAQDYLLGAAVEGIVLCNIHQGFHSSWLEFFQERSLPFVSLGSSNPGLEDSMQADIRGALRHLTEHHLSMGSQHLVLLLPFHNAGYKGPLGETVTQRLEGFTEAIRAAGGEVFTDSSRRKIDGIPARPSKARRPAITGEIVYPEKTDEFENAFELGHFQAGVIIRSNLPADSLICSNDQVAAGALAACLEQGIAVPKTMRISGLDDAPFSRFCGVPLTTAQQPSLAMAQWSIERIVQLIEDPAERRKPQTRILPCKILLRQSTCGSSLAG